MDLTYFVQDFLLALLAAATDSELPEGNQCHEGMYLIADSTDYFEVDYGKGRGDYDSTEHLVGMLTFRCFASCLSENSV